MLCTFEKNSTKAPCQLVIVRSDAKDPWRGEIGYKLFRNSTNFLVLHIYAQSVLSILAAKNNALDAAIDAVERGNLVLR